MNILVTLLTIFDVLIALLIIALVLVQQSKSGGGLGTTFGGGGSDSLFGAHASTHLSRLTVVFATIFLVVTLALAIISSQRAKYSNLSDINSMLLSSPAKTEASMPIAVNQDIQLPIKSDKPVDVSPKSVETPGITNNVPVSIKTADAAVDIPKPVETAGITNSVPKPVDTTKKQ